MLRLGRERVWRRPTLRIAARQPKLDGWSALPNSKSMSPPPSDASETTKPAGETCFDVLGLGVVAVDDVLYVNSFPVADTKVRALRGPRRCGGLTGAALVAAARLGARCAYAGCLGTDENSQFVARNFAREGVDISHAPCLAEATIVHSTIIVAKENGSRNVFFEDQGMIGAHDSLPAEEVIRAAKVLFIDHKGMKGNLRAVRAARAAGVAIVADFEINTDPSFRPVLDLVDHLVLSHEFARLITGQASAAAAAITLNRPDREVVIITCGAEGCWSVSGANDGKPVRHPAFNVSAIDTVGCGDVFHGAYSASLASGAPLAERIIFASAAAALNAMCGEIPRLAEVRQFLKKQARSAPSA
jgi:sugar/nucleoside kinase (ribokinase family)